MASDFYRGKTKSIYEREPLFKDFVQTIPQRYGGPINIYNTGTLDTIKTDFKNMVDDKWNRSQMKDPSVEMSFGAKGIYVKLTQIIHLHTYYVESNISSARCF